MPRTGHTTTHTTEESMRAVVQSRYGSADVLEVGFTARPTLTPTRVLIEVRAAGIDRGTWHLVTGLPYAVRLAGYGVTKPKQPVPGLDVAGRVVAIGSEVTRFAVGDEVFGIADGSFAQFAAAEQDKLAAKPAGLSWEQAGVAAVSGSTALQALTDIGRLQPGQHVLVLGASGGVGSYAVQVAKALGAEVTGVASGAKADLVRSLGADHVVDYTTTDATDGSTAYDLIIDTGGNTPVRRLRRALAPDATLVIVGGENGGRWTGGVGRQMRAMALSPFTSQRMTTFFSKEHYEPMERLAQMMEAGSVVPAVDRVVELGQVPQALADLEAGRVRGKVAVRLS